MESLIKWKTGDPSREAYYIVTNDDGWVTVAYCHRRIDGTMFWHGVRPVAWCEISGIKPYRQGNMGTYKCFRIERPKDTVNVLLMKHKMKDEYSFINLTKGHICPCRFQSEEEAMKDLEEYRKRGDIVEYKEIGL